MTPEEQAAADAAAEAAAADAAKANGGAPPPKDGEQPKPDQVGKDGKPAGAEGEAQPEEKAPEKYELKLAEGSKLGPADVTFIEKLAREHNLSNDSAQRILDQQDVLETEQSATFLEELKADKVFGGEKLEETQRLANAGLDKLLPKTDPLRARADAWLARGNGNNILVAAILSRVGRLTLEDGMTTGEPAGGGEKPKTTAELLYGNTPRPEPSV